MSHIAALLEAELGPIANGKLLGESVSGEALDSLVTSYIVLNDLAKRIEKRLSAIKDLLHAEVETRGIETEKGKTFRSGTNFVERERRVDKAPSAEKLRALLKTNEIEFVECFDVIESVVLNPSKVQMLVDLGKLDGDQVAAIRDVSWAIKAKAGKELQSEIENAFGETGKKSRARK